jgi:large repetitive protein
LCAQLSAGVAGALLWAWDKDGSLLNNFDIGPGDPVLDVLSPWSDPAHTCSPPAPPSGVAAAAGSGSASVSWVAPISDGGAPITSYTVTASPGGQTATTDGSTTTATLPGLTNGQAYTFTVTGTNAAGTSDMSSASASVTPQTGNTAATGIASPSAGGTVTTGSDPATTGGITSSVTVPAGTSGGGLTLTQTATNQTAPSGYLLGGVQVDITAPSGTATNPLTLTFTITPPSDLAPPPDPTTLAASQIYRAESGAPVLVPDCQLAGQALADGSPCVASRQYVPVGAASDIQLTVLTASASHWMSARPTPGAVTVSDNGYSPTTVTVRPGAYVNWTWNAKKSHSVTDSIGLGGSGQPWFSSGLKNSGNYRFTFPAAGTFAYKSTAKGDSMTGSVVVPVVITPTSGSIAKTFSVIWSTRTLAGYTFTVQYRFKPTGSTKWTNWTTWQNAVSSTSASFVPSQGTGTYAFHALVRNTSSGRTSASSPDVLLTLS